MWNWLYVIKKMSDKDQPVIIPAWLVVAGVLAVIAIVAVIALTGE